MTIRILATGDDHFDEHSRFDECIRVHAWMVELARDLKIDLFLDGGDICERASTPLERQAVAEWLTPMAEIAPGLIADGNHDRPKDAAIWRRLRTKHPITVEEGAGVHLIGGAVVAAVAWPEKATMLAAAGTIEGSDALVREALQHVFRGLGAQLADHDLPRIGLMHAMIDGSIASTNQPLLGMPLNIGLADLALLGADLGVLSHIHKAQRFDPPIGGPWLYAGSSHRKDYGETERKSVLFAEFEGRRLVKLEEIETPATKMMHIESTWAQNAWDAMRGLRDIADVAGAEVRWTYAVPVDQREAAEASAREWEDKLRAAGAKSVKVEPVPIVETRARAPEVAAASSLPDKLDAHWESNGFDPADRRGALHSKAAELEQEEANRAA
jgi:DNA repair exonuclease SbcCD nuclease subunit